MNYVVQPGDTLWSIASRFGVSMNDILRANGLASANYIYVGQTLYIPTTGGIPFPIPIPTPGPGPGPGPGLAQRVDRLERQYRRLETEQERQQRQIERLENRVRRLET